MNFSPINVPVAPQLAGKVEATLQGTTFYESCPLRLSDYLYRDVWKDGRIYFVAAINDSTVRLVPHHAANQNCRREEVVWTYDSPQAMMGDLCRRFCQNRSTP